MHNFCSVVLGMCDPTFPKTATWLLSNYAQINYYKQYA